MNCVIEGNSVKVFGKAIHALSRVGDELWLDPSLKGLALRSVSSAHSAYGCFLFSPLFFQQYNLGSDQNSDGFKCKLFMKTVLPLFRCLTSIERSVERCHISVSSATDRVKIKFHCRHGITKTHNIGFQESEALQAVFIPHLCPNVMKAPARLLGDMVIHFPMCQEEITLSTTPLKVTLRNYQDGGKGSMKMMCTEMSLHPDEFNYIQVGVDSNITFCLKELRGILSFADTHGFPVSVHFGAAGTPVCFSVENTVLEATVVLATLTDSESRSPSQDTVIPASPGCAGAAAPHVGVCEGHSKAQQEAPHEVIPSSQGSPVNRSPEGRSLLPYIGDPATHCASSNWTPASTRICSLLFTALSSDHGGGSSTHQPVLASYSDEDISPPGSPQL